MGQRRSVIDMTNAASESRLTTKFDEFLFAPIGEDGNGAPLSVVSALARLNVDPWQEAAELARLPGEAAARRLTALLADLPDGVVARSELGTIVVRLLALLLRQANPPGVAPSMTVIGVTVKRSWIVAIYAAVMICIITAQFLSIIFQSPARPQDAAVPSRASSTVSADQTPRR